MWQGAAAGTLTDFLVALEAAMPASVPRHDLNYGWPIFFWRNADIASGGC